jgi:membrane fusion protein (multidrug efflux system)
MSEQRPQHRSVRLMAVPILAIALGAAAYGIWSRRGAIEELKLVADDASLPRVQVISPIKGPEGQSQILPGEVVAWNEAQIYGQVSGYIAHWYKDYGAIVKAGDVLATVEAPSLDAQFEVSKAKLRVAQAQSNIADITVKRFNALTPSVTVTQQVIDDKNAIAAEQKAELAAAQQNVEHYQAMMEFKNLVAPFAGIVTARRVNVGDFISTTGSDTSSRSTALAPFSVADIHKLRVFVSVPQEFANVLKPGLEAILHILNNPDEKIPAQFLTMAGAVDRATRTIVTEFVLDNPSKDLFPGAYVDVELKFPSDPNILIVPSQALLFRAQGMQAAVLDGQDRVQLQNVVLGRNLGLNIQVLSGLKLTDRIVANPSLGLLDGQQVKVVHAVRGYEPTDKN